MPIIFMTQDALRMICKKEFMKKVFVLICEGFHDYDGGTDVYVFSSYEKAKSQYD